MVAKKLLIEKFSHDDYVFRQDSEGDKFYIILSGTVIGISESARFDSYGNELFKDQKEVIRLGEGNSFGEMALISGASRSLSMKAYNDVTLISLHKDDFLKCFGDKISDKIMEIKSFLEGVKYFKHFKEPDLKTLASKLILRNCKNNQMLCDQGEQCRNLFILKNGQIILTRIVDTQKVDLSEFPPVLIQKLKQLPEKIEIEVKTKYHSGDILLLTEVLNGRQSKYRLKSGLPSQIFFFTSYHLKK